MLLLYAHIIFTLYSFIEKKLRGSDASVEELGPYRIKSSSENASFLIQ
jgi:hypothetical protein